MFRINFTTLSFFISNSSMYGEGHVPTIRATPCILLPSSTLLYINTKLPLSFLPHSLPLCLVSTKPRVLIFRIRSSISSSLSLYATMFIVSHLIFSLSFSLVLKCLQGCYRNCLTIYIIPKKGVLS